MMYALRFLAVAMSTLTLALQAAEADQLQVGTQPDGRIVVPTNQILHPAGKQITFAGRPVDLAWTADGKTVAIKNMKSLLFYDLTTGQLHAPLVSPADFGVTGLLANGDRIFVTDASNHVRIAAADEKGSYDWNGDVRLNSPAGGEANPAGMAWAPEPNTLWVAATLGNSVQRVDLLKHKVVDVVDVGVAPYTVVATKSGKVYVSNWGGDPPRAGNSVGQTSGTAIRVDPQTGIANDGTVSVVARSGEKFKQLKTIRVGLHPSGMTLNAAETRLYVANATSDSVSVIDTQMDAVIETIACKPDGKLPLGSGSNAVALSPDGNTLYVANGTNNCIAVIALGANASGIVGGSKDSVLAGLIPTGWFPGAILISGDGKTLVVANVKGHGALSQTDPKLGHRTRDHLGTISIIDVPDAARLAAYSREVSENNRLAYSLAGLDPPRADIKSVPIPARHGEPSCFKHVVYIIKENRTYDQIFGDIPEGNGDPAFLNFGDDNTPNQHALARQFTLFDNFYCSGTLSVDGHAWVNEAYCSDYLEKSFGALRDAPNDLQDPLAFSPSGFLWDNALSHHKTFFNYGEGTLTDSALSWADAYKQFKNNAGRLKVNVHATLPGLKEHTHPDYPGWLLDVPDVYRAHIFLDEFKLNEQKKEFPNLTYIYLPSNHTAGLSPNMPTPQAMVADNDLAVGQIVEAISKSSFWPETCIFVVEDDAQNGADHVDGHRAPALVISPYTRRKFVDHTNYNQTGMVKTMELILGLPCMNQLDLSATAMRNCFQEKPDATPFQCIANKIALDTLNPPLEKQRGSGLMWATKSKALCFTNPDCADEGTLNRAIWFSARGDAPYPESNGEPADDDGDDDDKKP